MKIKKYFHHDGPIESLIERHPALKKFKYSTINKQPKFKWNNTTFNTIEWHAVVSFFGKSGYGKSSTINAFFGDSILKTSDVAACTIQCDCLDFKINDDYFLSFSDFPGIEESEYKDKEYLEIYKNFLDSSSIVVYVLRADMRDYAIDEHAFQSIFPNDHDRKKVIFAINCCDKIEPISRVYSKTPSQEQIININKKIKSLEKTFKPHNPIVPYSAQTMWNMDVLAEAIVKVAEKSEEILFR